MRLTHDSSKDALLPGWLDKSDHEKHSNVTTCDRVKKAVYVEREAMKYIRRVKLHNFKRFPTLSIDCDRSLNLFVGDNESGKSTILLAIDLVLSGSRSKVETYGLDSLFRVQVIRQFLDGDQKYEELPELYVELYLNEQNDPTLNGNWNSDGEKCDGLVLHCRPNEDLSEEISRILSEKAISFPFEYYSISFKTFSGEGYTGYRKFLRHLSIDTSQINNEYATKSYIKTMYEANVDETEKSKHQYQYRHHKKSFEDEVLKDLNERLPDYRFSVRTSSKSNLETDITISEEDIAIENMGKGNQCFVRTQFALNKKTQKHDLDVVLIEEPENHLSHVKMNKLIEHIRASQDQQLFVATHSNRISTRLDLRKAILLHTGSTENQALRDLPEETAKFFEKAPDTNVLDFVLSERVILVEGAAEYMLMERFYEKVMGAPLKESGVHVLSVGGTSFKRYLDLAQILGMRTAVVRDNDGNYQENCVDNYAEYKAPNIAVFAEEDSEQYTFELVLYAANTEVCDSFFEKGRRTLSVRGYMLGNKSEAAYRLLSEKGDDLVAPEYINQAIAWING